MEEQAKPRATIIGTITVVEDREAQNPVMEDIKCAMLIEFPDSESLRESLKAGRVEFTIF